MACKLDGAKTWTAIVVTCQSERGSYVVQQELEARQKKGLIAKDVLLLTVEDPRARVGSGGATLNALYVVAEHLGAKLGYTIVTADILKNAHILLIHMGRNYPFDACGRTFTCLPLNHKDSHDGEFVFTNFDMLLHTVSTNLAVESPPGVWMCSTDMFLTTPVPLSAGHFENREFCIITTLVSHRYARNHGAVKISKDGLVQDIIFKGKPDVLAECFGKEEIPIISGVVYISTGMAEKLLSLTTTPPLDACTYIGIDNGATPIEMSIFFDFALSMSDGMDQEAFISGERSGVYGTSEKIPGAKGTIMKQARSLLWRELHGTHHVTAVVAEQGQYSYLDQVASTLHGNLFAGTLLKSDENVWKWQQITHSQINQNVELSDQVTLINSIVEGGVELSPKSVISNCQIPQHVRTGMDSILSGLSNEDFDDLNRVTLPDKTFVQTIRIQMPILGKQTKMKVMTVIGKFDDVTAPMWKGSSTFCNSPWVLFLNATGITKEDLWLPHIQEDDMNIMNAKLFPVANASSTPSLADILWLTDTDNTDKSYLKSWRSSWRLSLTEILSLVDYEEEFSWRKKLFFAVGLEKIQGVLLGEKSQGLSQFYRNAAVDGYYQNVLTTLDEIARTSNSPGIAARTLANIADVLGHLTFGKGGMRSGPAANSNWKLAFDHFENGNISEGVKAMAVERVKWLNRPEHLIRAARHYEGGAQILIRHAVITAREFIKIKDGTPVPMGSWVVAECPARLDLSGGWSDTPPITYEHGGAVVTLAIQVDGKKPIGAKVCRIPEKALVLHVGSGTSETILTLKDYLDLSDYNQPHAPGALLKAAFYCADVVNYDTSTTLEAQLESRYGGGFEMKVWSNLPHGSGLGTSSILAGAILAALWTTVGKKFQLQDLIHAVLHLEQMLTTGGGWQDQVGGLAGGLALGTSSPRLPLFVQFKRLAITDPFIEKLNKQLVLLYTGKTRLARDLLQNVVRQWYARLPGIVVTEDDLVQNAQNCAAAVEDGNLETMGGCVNLYWEQKKLMAPGCEPAVVAAMRKALKPYTLGMSMAGAGGGGFLYILLKPNYTTDILPSILKDISDTEDISIHSAKVDLDGLSIRYEDGTVDSD